MQAALTTLGKRRPLPADPSIDLSGANLANADLTNADLTATELADADLTNASLRRANLTDAALVHAALFHADLTDAVRVKAKGARAKTRRRGQAREDVVLETVYWDAGTARLLPRLFKGRTRGPVFLTHRRPGPR